MHTKLAISMTDADSLFFAQLGQRIASLRKERGLTQVELAQTLGLSQPLLAYYETGRRRIPVSYFPKLAESLSVSIEALFGLPLQPNTKRGPTSKLQQRLDQISQMPRPVQLYVLQFLDQVIATNQDKIAA